MTTCSMTGRDAACMRLGTWPAYLDHDVNVGYSRDERHHYAESCLFEVGQPGLILQRKRDWT